MNACVGGSCYGSPDLKEVLFSTHFSRCFEFSNKPQSALPVVAKLFFFSVLCFFGVLFCNFVAAVEFV